MRLSCVYLGNPTQTEEKQQQQHSDSDSVQTQNGIRTCASREWAVVHNIHHKHWSIFAFKMDYICTCEIDQHGESM